ncbi:MAG: MFS transporter [Steroidobacteraceae bacterium]|nr:MFS transporter [Steroidobacteraceae bacterium]
MLATVLLGFSSGLPFNLTGATLQAWLADSKLDIRTIGLFSLVGLPYVLKFLWAPLLDRYLPPLLGRRRGWILVYQLCLAVAIGVMGLSSPQKAPFVLGLLALIVASLSASQDIVIDAYRVDLIPAEQRALAAAASAFGYRTAAMFAGAVIVLIAASTGWRAAYGIVAVLMAMTTFVTLWSPEPEHPGRPPPTLLEAVIEPAKDFLRQPGAWGLLLLVLLYKFGDAFALSLYSAFMIKGMGFSLAELSIAGKVNMTISTMIGTALGGWLYMRWGMFRSLLTFGVLQAATILMFLWLDLAGKHLALMVVATSVDNLAGGMGLAAFIAFLMAQCTPNYSATQYALLSALAAVPRVLIASIAGAVVHSVGWAHFFVAAFLSAIPGVALLVWMRPRIRHLEGRERATFAKP